MNLPKPPVRLALGAICLFIASCSPKAEVPQSIKLSGGAWLDKANGTSEMLSNLEIHLCALPLADHLEPDLTSSLPLDHPTYREVHFNRLQETLVEKQDHAKKECIHSTQTDSDGKYVFENIDPRIYTLYAAVSSEEVAAWWIIEYLNLRTEENILVLKPDNATGLLQRYPELPSLIE